MSMKSIEIYYDIATIPDITDRSDLSAEAFEFRNDAIEHIKVALENAEAGEWEGAEIGGGEVNFGFSVENHDEAERLVRESVAGTVFDCIRSIERFEISSEQLFEMEKAATSMPQVKPMNLFETVGMLVSRQLPKRFRQIGLTE